MPENFPLRNSALAHLSIKFKENSNSSWYFTKLWSEDQPDHVNSFAHTCEPTPVWISVSCGFSESTRGKKEAFSVHAQVPAECVSLRWLERRRGGLARGLTDLKPFSFECRLLDRICSHCQDCEFSRVGSFVKWNM